MSGAYSRLYHKFSREYPDIYADDRLLAPWVRLLMVADASWPLRPPVPRSLSARAFRVLSECGLLIVYGDTYTVRGLDAERTRRGDAARKGAAKRWENERNANADADAMPRRDETSKSIGEGDVPPPPARRGRRKDQTNPRATGMAPRQLGQSPRQNGTSTRHIRQSQKTGPTALGDVLRRANEMGRPE